MSGLTSDQRWLLYSMGGWMMRDCLIGPAGTDYLMQSMWGGCGHAHPEGGPTWMTSFETRGGRVVSPASGQARVVVTKAEINAYARALPTAIRDELIAVRTASTTERSRTDGWCHCPWATTVPNAHSAPCPRYHPTHAEDDAHYAEINRLDELSGQILRRALRLQEHETGQLDLFSAV